MKKNISKAEAIKALQAIEEWANHYPAYLSERTDYARGFKQGILQAKNTVREILCESIENYPND